jgi:hypothetical protein
MTEESSGIGRERKCRLELEVVIQKGMTMILE